MPNDTHEEFTEDMATPLRDLSQTSPRSSLDAQFNYCMADVDSLSNELGIPWEHTKDVPFASAFPFIGFFWNLESRTVSIPNDKKAKYLAAIATWRACRTHTLEEAQSLHGKLMHACYVAPMGKAYLTSLEAFLGVFHDRPFLPRSPPKHTSADLDWWVSLFQQRCIERPIPGPLVVTDHAAYSDASSATGVGIVIGHRWRAWRLLPGWEGEGRDIGWAEALGFYFLAATLFASSNHIPCYKVYGDNRGVVEGWWRGRSKNRPTNEVFKLVHALCNQACSLLISRYVRSEHNPADGPSRGVYPPLSLLLPAVPIPQQWRPFLVDFDAPRSFSEQRISRTGKLQQPRPKPSRDHSRLQSISHSLHVGEQFAEQTIMQAQSW
jgi:hypothetical protein